MSEQQGEGHETRRPKKPECRLLSLAEALQAGGHPPPDSLGTVACRRCLGVFEVNYDIANEPRAQITIETPGHISCEEGFANHDGHHLEG